MALSGLDIYKLLSKTNCKKCGFATCLAFAMQLAKKAVSIDACPYVSPDVREKLLAASLPPIREVRFGPAAEPTVLGNETVLFRHEEKFRNPCAIGFVLKDDMPEGAIREALAKIHSLDFERVGQKLAPEAIAISQTGSDKAFVSAVKTVCALTAKNVVLLPSSAQALAEALSAVSSRKPLVRWAVPETLASVLPVIKQYQVPLAVRCSTLEQFARLTQELNTQGIHDIVLDIGAENPADRLWLLTQIRRLALKRSNRSVGYPVMLVADTSGGPLGEALDAATGILKYASLVLLQGAENWKTLGLLTLRQNIYSDPQKPLQIEPKVYSIGQAGERSPVLVTTNFSLTYYTVAGEVEASKVPARIISVDTDGMSVLTAWAAEKFTAESVAGALASSGVREMVSHKKLIIPGYVAMMSGDLEEKSGWEILVGPKEAAGLPSFLKNIQL